MISSRKDRSENTAQENLRHLIKQVMTAHLILILEKYSEHKGSEMIKTLIIQVIFVFICGQQDVATSRPSCGHITSWGDAY